jgi:outer membrane protein OmpA-like peptidoglycan-associated protein
MKSPQIHQLAWVLSMALVAATAAADMSARNAKPLQLDERAPALQARFDALQKRLDALAPLQSSPDPWAAYHLAKAQAWLAAAFDARTQHDSSGAFAQSWDQAEQLTKALEQKNANISRATPLIAGAHKVREDLWLLAEKIQAAAGFRCASTRLAQFEVQLVQAGLADRALGWRHAKPYAQAAERLGKDAQALNVACPQTVTRAEELPAEIRDQPPSVQVQTLARRVHFALNSAQISLRSAEVLEQIAFVLRSQPGMVLQLTGHADQRGSTSYNLRLSWARARAVRDFLTRSGVLSTQLQVQALGKKVLLSMGQQVMDHARNRRVEFEVRASSSGRAPATSLTEQEMDLQPEPTLRSPK